MNHLQQRTDREVVLEPPATPVGTVIVLHGLGADGWDFVPVVDEFRLPATLPVRFLFPHAPVRPVTANGGYEMRAWYDIRDFTLTGREDLDGMTEATARVHDYVRHQRGRGVAAQRVVLAGFSQGGAVALHAGLRYPEALAGIVALSTYLPFQARIGVEVAPTNREVPILMCHGSRDPVVSVELGRLSRDVLNEHGYEVEWHEYPMAHEVSRDEIAVVARWIQRLLG